MRFRRLVTIMLTLSVVASLMALPVAAIDYRGLRRALGFNGKASAPMTRRPWWMLWHPGN